MSPRRRFTIFIIILALVVIAVDSKCSAGLCEVTTFAGSGAIDSVDGTGTNAAFGFIDALAVDPSTGSVYIADFFFCNIRRITIARQVTTIAGSTSGTCGFQDGSALNALFNNPDGITVSNTGSNVFVADTYNCCIRRLSGGTVSTFAGVCGSTTVGSNVYCTSPGSLDAVGVSAKFNYPYGLAMDSANRLFVADGSNNNIRVVYPNQSVFTVLTSSAVLHDPRAIAVDANNARLLFVADTYNHRICVVDLISRALVRVIAGNGTSGFRDGVGNVSVMFDMPMGITVLPSGNLLVADTGNQVLRELNPTTGEVRTTVGSVDSQGTADGVGSLAKFANLAGIAFFLGAGGGHVFVADCDNSVVRLVTHLTASESLSGRGGTATETSSISVSAALSSMSKTRSDTPSRQQRSQSLSSTQRWTATQRPKQQTQTEKKKLLSRTMSTDSHDITSSISRSSFNDPTSTSTPSSSTVVRKQRSLSNLSSSLSESDNILTSYPSSSLSRAATLSSISLSSTSSSSAVKQRPLTERVTATSRFSLSRSRSPSSNVQSTSVTLVESSSSSWLTTKKVPSPYNVFVSSSSSSQSVSGMIDYRTHTSSVTQHATDRETSTAYSISLSLSSSSLSAAAAATPRKDCGHAMHVAHADLVRLLSLKRIASNTSLTWSAQQNGRPAVLRQRENAMPVTAPPFVVEWDDDTLVGGAAPWQTKNVSLVEVSFRKSVGRFDLAPLVLQFNQSIIMNSDIGQVVVDEHIALEPSSSSSAVVRVIIRAISENELALTLTAAPTSQGDPTLTENRHVAMTEGDLLFSTQWMKPISIPLSKVAECMTLSLPTSVSPPMLSIAITFVGAPIVVPKSTVKALLKSVAAIAFASFSISAGNNVARARLLLGLTDCQSDDSSLSITGLSYGPHAGEYLRGAVVGNTFLLYAFCVLVVFVDFATRRVVDLLELDKCSTTTTVAVITRALVAAIHVPSVFAVPLSQVVQQTVTASVALVVMYANEAVGATVFDVITAVVGLIATLALSALFSVVLLNPAGCPVRLVTRSSSTSVSNTGGSGANGYLRQFLRFFFAEEKQWRPEGGSRGVNWKQRFLVLFEENSCLWYPALDSIVAVLFGIAGAFPYVFTKSDVVGCKVALGITLLLHTVLLLTSFYFRVGITAAGTASIVLFNGLGFGSTLAALLNNVHPSSIALDVSVLLLVVLSSLSLVGSAVAMARVMLRFGRLLIAIPHHSSKSVVEEPSCAEGTETAADVSSGKCYNIEEVEEEEDKAAEEETVSVELVPVVFPSAVPLHCELLAQYSHLRDACEQDANDDEGYCRSRSSSSLFIL